MVDEQLLDEYQFIKAAFNDLARILIRDEPKYKEWLVLNYKDYLDETWFDEEICKEHNQVS